MNETPREELPAVEELMLDHNHLTPQNEQAMAKSSIAEHDQDVSEDAGVKLGKSLPEVYPVESWNIPREVAQENIHYPVDSWNFPQVSSSRQRSPAKGGAKQQLSQEEVGVYEAIRRMEALVVRTEELLKKADQQLTQRQRRFSQLQNEFRKIGEQQHRRLQKMKEKFTQISSELNNELNWERWSNTQRKQDLLQKAEALAILEEKESLSLKVKELQAQWKEIGPSFREDDKIWEAFRAACEKAFLQAKAHSKEQQEERKKNAVTKEELCKRADELAEAESTASNFQEMKSLQEQWKELGPVPKDLHWPLERRFSKAGNVFFRKRREHFNELEQKRLANMKAKTDLCERAEHFAKKKDEWARMLPEVQKLQAEWKEIGPVAKEDQETIFQRFKVACDIIYGMRREDHDKELEQQKASLEARQKICEEMELVVKEADVEQIGKKMDELEQRFKNAGRVPHKNMAGIQKRFHNVLELYKKRIEENKSKREQQRIGASSQKSEICSSLEELLFEKDWNGIQGRVEPIRAKWKSSGLSSQEKRLQQRWDKASKWLTQNQKVVWPQIKKEAAQAESHLERLCHRIEELAGIQTSEVSAAQLKMWMVAELAQKMGKQSPKKASTPKQEAEDIVAEWWTCGPVRPELRGSLEERLSKAKEILLPAPVQENKPEKSELVVAPIVEDTQDTSVSQSSENIQETQVTPEVLASELKSQEAATVEDASVSEETNSPN